MKDSVRNEYWFVTDDGTSGEGGGIETNPPDEGEQQPDTEQKPEKPDQGDGSQSTETEGEQGTIDGTDKNGDGTGKNIKVKKISIQLPSKKLAAGRKIKLTAKVAPGNATDSGVTWGTASNNATIDRNGNLILNKKAAGKKIIITATANDGSGRSAYCRITVMKNAVKSVKLSAPKKTLKAGRTMKLKAIVKTTGKKANKTLKWTSSNPRYATVSKSGTLKAKKAGKGKKVTVMARSVDGTDKKAKVTIAIK